jgi:hypothetical protein
MVYNVNVSTNDQKGGQVNLNQQVEADNVLDALHKAHDLIAATIVASGLQLAPQKPLPPQVPPA